MKRIIISTIIVVLLVGLMSLVPDRPGTAYPPNTPVPPTYIRYPAWWWAYCTWPTITSDWGFVGVIWWFPDSKYMAVDGNVGKFYAYNYLSGTYDHTDTYDLLIRNFVRGGQVMLENIWQPHREMEINLQGYVRLKNEETGLFEDFNINPTVYWLKCQRSFLPAIRK